MVVLRLLNCELSGHLRKLKPLTTKAYSFLHGKCDRQRRTSTSTELPKTRVPTSACERKRVVTKKTHHPSGRSFRVSINARDKGHKRDLQLEVRGRYFARVETGVSKLGLSNDASWEFISSFQNQSAGTFKNANRQANRQATRGLQRRKRAP
jgi:hypothetical protein